MLASQTLWYLGKMLFLRGIPASSKSVNGFLRERVLRLRMDRYRLAAGKGSEVRMNENNTAQRVGSFYNKDKRNGIQR